MAAGAERVLLAGATGVVGTRLIPLLVERRYEVHALTRSPQSASVAEGLGARPLSGDALDRDAVIAAAERVRPHHVVHQLTALPKGGPNPRRLKRDLAATNRLRREATRHLVEAAERVGAERIVAQSIAFAYRPEGSPVVDEEHPLYTDGLGDWDEAAGAVAALEEAVLGARGPTGVVLRYGLLYGPGTTIAADGAMARMLRRRRLPVIGGGGGLGSFCHVDDAAAAAAAALRRGEGVYNVCDDHPAPAREWIPALAEAFGAPGPLRLPRWLARPLAGRPAVEQMTGQRGASNRRARAELGWQPRHPDWREGFRELGRVA